MSEAAAVSEAVSISASAARRLNAILKGERGRGAEDFRQGRRLLGLPIFFRRRKKPRGRRFRRHPRRGDRARRPGLARDAEGRRTRLRRRPDGPVVPGQEPERGRLLRLRGQFFGLGRERHALGARYCGSEASEAIPFPGANSIFSSLCGDNSRQLGGGPVAGDRLCPFGRKGARSATGQRRLRNTSGQIPPSRTQARPSQTKKMSLDFLGFLGSILGFSIGYGRSKQKNMPPKAELRRRPAANILRGRSPEATG